jgi:hypothetical protein
MDRQDTLIRIGGLSAMLGVVVAVGGALLGPLDLPSHDIRAVLETFSGSVGRFQLHGLAVSVGTLLILGGFVALQASIPEGAAGAWARLGLAAAVVMTVVHLLGAMMGGSVLPTLAELHATTPDGDSSASLLVGHGLYVFYESLLAPTFLTLAATVLLFSAAVLQSNYYRRWHGWLGAVAGMWTAAGAAAFAVAGPIGAADLLVLFIPGFMLGMVWIFAIGVLLWRRGADLRHAGIIPAAARPSNPAPDY